eukprot:1172256-Prorocentrum_minimum.AAC.1
MPRRRTKSTDKLTLRRGRVYTQPRREKRPRILRLRAWPSSHLDSDSLRFNSATNLATANVHRAPAVTAFYRPQT